MRRAPFFVSKEVQVKSSIWFLSLLLLVGCGGAAPEISVTPLALSTAQNSPDSTPGDLDTECTVWETGGVINFKITATATGAVLFSGTVGSGVNYAPKVGFNYAGRYFLIAWWNRVGATAQVLFQTVNVAPYRINGLRGTGVFGISATSATAAVAPLDIIYDYFYQNMYLSFAGNLNGRAIPYAVQINVDQYMTAGALFNDEPSNEVTALTTTIDMMTGALLVVHSNELNHQWFASYKFPPGYGGMGTLKYSYIMSSTPYVKRMTMNSGAVYLLGTTKLVSRAVVLLSIEQYPWFTYVQSAIVQGNAQYQYIMPPATPIHVVTTGTLASGFLQTADTMNKFWFLSSTGVANQATYHLVQTTDPAVNSYDKDKVIEDILPRTGTGTLTYTRVPNFYQTTTGTKIAATLSQSIVGVPTNYYYTRSMPQ